METTLEEVAKHRVKLTVEVTPDEAKPTLDLAYRHVGGSVSIPGFRKGKIPRKVIDAQVGRGAVMQEFLEHALAEFYPRALREHDLAPIAEPDFDDLEVSDVEAKGFGFTATVDVRPRLRFEKSDYEGLRLERPSAAVTESEVDDQLDRLRDRFAELEVVGHPAHKGDYAQIDIRATVHEQEVPEGTAQDLLYEVGSGGVVEKLDDELEDKRKGDILKFNAALPPGAGKRAGQEATFTVLVKEIKAKKLAALDDDFAKTVSEFDTLDELKGDLREKLGAVKEAAVDAGIRDRALAALIDAVDVELPDKLVDEETEARVHSSRRRAEQQGTTLEAVLQASDVEELEFRSDARAHALQAIKADLALEAVARAEDLEVTGEELNDAVKAIAKDVGRDVKEIRKALEGSGQITSVAGDIIRSKALDHVVEHAEVVEADSQDDDGPPSEEPPEGPVEG